VLLMRTKNRQSLVDKRLEIRILSAALPPKDLLPWH
jgi:hypothetical protein